MEETKADVMLENDKHKWSVGPSDDEDYEPTPEEIVQLYETLDKGGILELEWQCPGRRAPASHTDNQYYKQDEENDGTKTEEASDFDFADEMSLPKFIPRKGSDGGLKGSAKKKTTSLDGVLSNMRRHRQLEELEKQSEPNVPSPTVTASTTITTTTS